MEQQFDFEVLVKLKSKKRRKIWKRILSAMMCVVVFCTTYMLILPAITKENQAFCGIDEHTHNEKCYEKTLLCEAHVHTEECFTPQTNLICTEPTDDGHTHGEACHPVTELQLCCGLAESEGHTHTDSCMVTETVLVCSLEETPGHTHGEACHPVTETQLCCGLAESEGHTHTDSCMVTETVLTCPLEESAEHTHGDGCYTAVTSLACGMEEAPGHVHGDDCYTTTTTYGCGQEEAAGHTHTDACYTEVTTCGCGLEEAAGHTHTDACYTEVTIYGCGLEETPPSHVHTDTCYETIQQNCPVETAQDHEHTDACYSQTLICTREEHTHSVACFSDPSADLESVSTWEATLPELTGSYSQDILAIAQSQLGYTESSRNYIVGEDGDTKGYTRYGAWYGIPYGDWCAMFASFCLHYAGVEEVPLDASCSNWVKELKEQELYEVPSEYIPQPGDIIFFDWEEDACVDHVGLVEEVIGTDVITIEGNSGNRVAKNKYEFHDDSIIGYGMVSKIKLPVIEDAPQVDLENTDAWAVVESDGTIPEVPQSEPDKPARFASTFNLLRMTSTDQDEEIVDPSKIGVPLDLKNYIEDVTMYDTNGNEIPSGSAVTEGDRIKFKINFVLPSQQLGVMHKDQPATVYTDTLIYDLPKSIKVVQGAEGDIVNSGGAVVGRFVIDSTSGTITMKFLNEYVQQNISGMQIHGNIAFFSTVTKITDEENENQDYEFREDHKLDVVIKEKIEAVGDLRIEKQKVSVDGEKIIYEVRVTSTEGTTGPITITDKMSPGLTFDQSMGVQKGDGTSVDAIFNPGEGNSSFTMTLPEMAPGESYVIRYSCLANVDLLGVDMTVRNTASVTGKDSQDNELKHEITVDHTFEVLKKTGVNNGDGTITWTITVNPAKADISGWILKDIVSTAAQIAPYTGTVTICNSSGTVIKENATLPYTFPDGSKDTYIVTYTTTHNLGDGDMIYNKAILKDEDTDITVVTGTGIGSPIQKTGQAGTVKQDDKGKNLLPITWTVTLDTGIGAIPAGEVLNDKMDSGSANAMYMTYEQLTAAVDAMKAALEAVGGQVGQVQASVYVPGAEVGTPYNWNDLTADVDNCQSFLFEKFAVTLDKEVPKGHVVTFTYETYGEFDNNLVKDTVFENQFNISEHYEVNGRVDFTTGTIEATKMAMKPYDPNGGNQDWRLEWIGVEGTSKVKYEDLIDSYLAWAIQLNIPSDYAGKGNVVIYEDLPDGVSVKGLDLPFTDSVPTSRLQMRDMVPGNTYTWDFKVYPLDQYVYPISQREGEENISITVKVTDGGDLEITVPGVVFELMGGYAAKSNLTQAQTYLYIYTQINDDFAWTPKTEGSFEYVNIFENRFTMKNEAGRVLDIGSQSQEVTMDESKEIIRKDATIDDNNIITYAVLLNTKQKDLIKNAATLKVHDELTYTETAGLPLHLRLVPGSVKLYEITMNADGTYTKGNEVKTNYNYEETSTTQFGRTAWTHTIDLNIPDNKALVLEYKYRAAGVKEVMYNISNTCTIQGIGEGGLDENHKIEIQVQDTMAQADTSGVMLYKVDANSDGVFLEKAKFNIYIWNETAGADGQGAYIIVNHPNSFELDEDMGETDFVTSKSGMIVIDGSTIAEEQFAYNTAYYIVEKEPPEGYYLSPEPYYFQIVHPDLERYPKCQPDNFTGDALSRGDIIYRENVRATTEISVEKYWKSYNGANMTVTGDQVSEVTLELWQELEGDPDSAKVYGTYKMTPDEKGNWSLTITDLPKATKKTDGTKDKEYLYSIKEVSVKGFTLESSENNEGINSGIIKLVNQEKEGYELPETGGTGTHLYTTAGLLLMISSAAYLLYIHRKRRREASS